MNLLFEIADGDLIFLILSFLGLVIFGAVIVYIVKKNSRVKPLAEEERYDNPKEEVTLTEEQKQAKEELERVFNMMSADLEAKEEEPSVIDEFEKSQEENAIISYQELMRQAKAKGQIKEEVPEFTEEKYEEPTYEQIYEEEPKEEKKFKNSEFISPIFGIQSTNASYPTVKKFKRNEEDTDNREFLNNLKEFRQNL